MNRQIGRGFVLITGIAIGFASGISVSSDHQSASAAVKMTPAIQALDNKISKNSSEIKKLQRQIQSFNAKFGSIGRKVQANRQATRTIATRSGIRIELSDN